VIKISYKFKNLEIEMLRSDMTRRKLAKQIGVSYNTISNKINNAKPFYREEMFKIKDCLKSQLTLDELFLLEEVEGKE